jgi:hypothetical protein
MVASESYQGWPVGWPMALSASVTKPDRRRPPCGAIRKQIVSHDGSGFVGFASDFVSINANIVGGGDKARLHFRRPSNHGTRGTSSCPPDN